MEKKLDQIEVKIDKVEERLNSIDKSLERATISIEHHIKRTDLLEESVEHLRKDFKPVEKHVHYVHGALKFIGLLSLVTTFILGLIKLINNL